MKSIPFPPRRILAYAAGVMLLSAFALPAKAATIGPDVYGYTATGITYNFEDLTEVGINANAVLDNTDDEPITFPIPFTFVFYGKAYTSVSINANGMLTFVQEPYDCATAVNITTTAPGQFDDIPMILPFWHDWDFKYGQSDEAYYAIFGSAPNRRLVIQWEAADDKESTATNTVTFEAKIFEGSNNIEFHYQDATVTDFAGSSKGKNATVGIRDTGAQTNHRVLQWLFNTASLTDESAIRFTSPQFRVNAISRLSTKHILLDCTGKPSSSNNIQATDSLITGFVNPPIGSGGADTTGHFTYEDGGATNLTRRFYRVVVP